LDVVVWADAMLAVTSAQISRARVMFISNSSVGWSSRLLGFANSRHDVVERRAVSLRFADENESHPLLGVDDECGSASNVDGVFAEAVIDAVVLGDGAVFIEEERKRDGMLAQISLRLEHTLAFFSGDVEQQCAFLL
jgi:hypothetical protein